MQFGIFKYCPPRCLVHPKQVCGLKCTQLHRSRRYYQSGQAGMDAGISVSASNRNKTSQSKRKQRLNVLCGLTPALLPVIITWCLLNHLAFVFRQAGRWLSLQRGGGVRLGPPPTDSECSSRWKNQACRNDAVRIWPLFGCVSQAQRHARTLSLSVTSCAPALLPGPAPANAGGWYCGSAVCAKLHVGLRHAVRQKPRWYF